MIEFIIVAGILVGIIYFGRKKLQGTKRTGSNVKPNPSTDRDIEK